MDCKPAKSKDRICDRCPRWLAMHWLHPLEQGPSTYNPDFSKAILENLWECRHLLSPCLATAGVLKYREFTRKHEMKWYVFFRPAHPNQYVRNWKVNAQLLVKLHFWFGWVPMNLGQPLFGLAGSLSTAEGLRADRSNRSDQSWPIFNMFDWIRFLAILANHPHGPSVLTSFHAAPKDSDWMSYDFGHLVFAFV